MHPAGPGTRPACSAGRGRWAGVAAPPWERRARPGVFEARSCRPVQDNTTSPGATPGASERVSRRRVSGLGVRDRGRGPDLPAARFGQGRGHRALLGARPPLQGSGGSGVPGAGLGFPGPWAAGGDGWRARSGAVGAAWARVLVFDPPEMRTPAELALSQGDRLTRTSWVWWGRVCPDAGRRRRAPSAATGRLSRAPALAPRDHLGIGAGRARPSSASGPRCPGPARGRTARGL